MTKNFKYSLEEVLDELDGNGLVITDYDLIDEVLSTMGLDLESTVEAEDE